MEGSWEYCCIRRRRVSIFLNKKDIPKEFINPKVEILKSKLLDLRFILKKERKYFQNIEVQKTELYKLLKSITDKTKRN